MRRVGSLGAEAGLLPQPVVQRGGRSLEWAAFYQEGARSQTAALSWDNAAHWCPAGAALQMGLDDEIALQALARSVLLLQIIVKSRDTYSLESGYNSQETQAGHVLQGWLRS